MSGVILNILTVLSFIGGGTNNYLITSQDSANINFVANWPFGESNTFALSDTIAFLGSGGGIFILNISNPDSIKEIGGVKTRNYVKKIFYYNSYLYAIDGMNEILIWSLDSLYQPQLISTIQSLKIIQDIFVDSSFIYLIGTNPNDFQSLEIYNVEDPTIPNLTGELTIQTTSLRKIFVEDGHAFIIESPNQFRIIDVSVPSSPSQLTWANTRNLPNDLIVSHNLLYIYTDSGFEIYDISNPQSPRRISEMYITGGIRSATITDSFVYAVGYIDSLYAIDIRDPYHPNLYNSYSVPDSCIGINAKDGYAYLANREGGLVVIDLSKSTSSYRYGFKIPNRYYTFSVYNNYAFLPDLKGNLWVIRNIRSNPTLVKSIHVIEAGIWDTYISNGHLFLSDIHGTIWAFEILDPSNPVLLDSLSLGGSNTLIFARNDTIFAVDGINGLSILTLASGSLRLIVSQNFNYRASPSDIYLVGNYVYVTDIANVGIWIGNVRNVFHPHWVTFQYLYSPTEIPTGIFVKNNLAFVTTYSGKLWILNMTNPRNPQLDTVLCDFNSSESYKLSKVFVEENKIYILGRGITNSKLWVKQLNDQYQTLGYYTITSQPQGIYTNAEYIYTINYFTGLQIYTYQGTGINEDEHYAWKYLKLNINSFGKFDISLSIPNYTFLKLKLFDISGRVIWERALYGGKHHIIKNIPCGVYFLYIKGNHTQPEILKIPVFK